MASSSASCSIIPLHKRDRDPHVVSLSQYPLQAQHPLQGYVPSHSSSQTRPPGGELPCACRAVCSILTEVNARLDVRVF